MSEAVYFIRGTVSGLVKIGRSGHVLSRFSGLQTAAAEPLELMGAIVGGEALEKELHAEFSKDRTRGEWFYLSPELEARIAGLLAERGISNFPKVKECADEYSIRAGNWTKYLLSREAARSGGGMSGCFGEIAQKTGLSAGSVENLYRLRIARISVADYEAVRVAAIAEYQREVCELRAELANVTGDVRSSAEAHLDAASILMEGER